MSYILFCIVDLIFPERAIIPYIVGVRAFMGLILPVIRPIGPSSLHALSATPECRCMSVLIAGVNTTPRARQAMVEIVLCALSCC